MREIQKIYRLKGELRLRKDHKAAMRAHTTRPAGLSHINQYSASPCPKGCVRVRAYSKGTFLEMPDTPR